MIDDILVLERSYAIILDNAPGASMIVAADKNLDITDKVVSRLRATPARPIVAPAAAQAPKPGAAPVRPASSGRPPGRPSRDHARLGPSAEPFVSVGSISSF